MARTIAVLLFTFTVMIQAGNHYVDNQATGNNDGSNWNNAWQSFNSINWNLVQAGDIIFISGGSQNAFYFETIEVPEGKDNFTITKGIESGHAGEVIIDGQSIRSHGITFDGNGSVSSNIVISEITFQNCTWAGIYGDGENSGGLQNITIDNCKFLNFQRAGVFFEGNGNVSNNHNIVVKNCYFDDSNEDLYESQSDGVYAQYMVDITVDHCTIILDNNSTTNADLHSDNCQTFWVDNVTYSNNIIVQQSDKTFGTQMLFVEEGNGTHTFFNNVLYRNCQNAKDTPIRIKRNSGSFSANVYYNSVYTTFDHCLSTDAPTNIKNNIFYSAGSNFHFTLVQFETSSGSSCDYNIYYDPSNVFTNTNFSGGQGGNSIEANPNFVSIDNLSNFDLRLNENSPAIDAGLDLGTPFNLDILGTLRPLGNGADIGAYEMDGGGLGDITPPKVMGAELLDSVTLKITFSESLDPNTAQNSSNYQISNGINVFTASLINDIVILNTSIHEPGNYTVSVSNVQDLAGNIISTNNTADYFLQDQNSEIVKYEIVNVYASVTPEPEHSADKTIDGLTEGDGDPDSRWAGDTMPEWIMFDLGMVKQVSIAKFSFYNWDNGRIYNYSVDVSTDSLNWNRVLSGVNSEPDEWTENDLGNLGARFIKVYYHSSNQSGNWAGLWECEIWGIDEPLAVELIEFSGHTDGQNVILNWKTSTELNNSGFEIERKTSDEYQPVGFINGSGTSSQEHSYNFTDTGLSTGSYYYRLKSIEFGGTVDYSDEILVDIVVPERFTLEQNFPNPFNPSTSIRFSLPQRSEVTLTIYTMLGEVVEKLVDQELEAGTHSYKFTPTNLSSGVYLYALESKEFKEMKKLVLLK
jgi:hypothetical protein